MDIDQLKQQWTNVNMRVERLEATNRRLADNMHRMRVHSITRRIVRRRIAMAACGFLLPVLLPLMARIAPLTPMLCITFGGFGVIMAIAQIYFITQVRDIHVRDITTTEALRRMVGLRIIERRIRIMGYLLGLPVVVVLFAYIYHARADLILAAAIGGVIGGAVGLAGELRDIRSIRELIRMTDNPDGLDPEE